MKWGSLRARSFRRIHFSVFRYRWSKNGFTGPKFEKRAPAGQLYSWFSVPFSAGSLPLSGYQCFTHPLYHTSISNGHLTAAVHHCFGASLASSIHRAYGVGQNHFITFCLLQGIIGPSSRLLLASEITLIYFAAHLAKTICYNTIKLYLFAVQHLHRQHDFPLKLCKMYRLQKVLTGIKQSQMSPKLTRYPITIHILNSIYNYFSLPKVAT